MTLLIYDSFDHYDDAQVLAKYIAQSSDPLISTGGRNGTNCLEMQNTDELGTSFASAATLVVGFAVKWSGLPPTTAQAFCRFRDTGTNHVELRITNSGTIQATRNGTAIGTGTAIVSSGVYYYFEAKVTISDAGGVVQTKLDGVTDLNLSGVDTRNGANASANYFQFEHNFVSQTMKVDDFYLLDTGGSAPYNDFLGDVRAEAIFVNGSGATTQWDPSASTNDSNVDDSTPDGDSTYNSTSTLNEIDTFSMGNITATSGTIYAVQVLNYARKGDAGSASLAPVIRHSGSDNVGTGVALSTDYQYKRQIYTANPGTASAWTVSDVNGMEVGYKKTA